MQFFKKILNKIFFFIKPIGLFIGKFLSPLTLTIVYFLIVVPTGLYLKITRRDILKLKVDIEKLSFWENRKNKPNFDEQY